MARSNTPAGQMPAFRSAAEKRAWLLEQLAAVEKEALLEDIAAGRNERITIRLGDSLRVEVGGAILYDGGDPAEFASALSRMVQALPLGTTFVVEAGKGGKVLGGGMSGDEGMADEQNTPTSQPRRRSTGGISRRTEPVAS